MLRVGHPKVDYNTFLTILNRPDGFKPVGTPGARPLSSPFRTLFLKKELTEEYTRGFEVFDREGKGFIKVGELRYILTHLGETMTDEEVDELLKLASVTPCVFPLLILSLNRLRF